MVPTTVSTATTLPTPTESTASARLRPMLRLTPPSSTPPDTPMPPPTAPTPSPTLPTPTDTPPSTPDSTMASVRPRLSPNTSTAADTVDTDTATDPVPTDTAPDTTGNFSMEEFLP